MIAKHPTSLDCIHEGLADGKAEDIITLSLLGKTNLADWMVVASGVSKRHLGTIADKIRHQLNLHGFSCQIDGAGESDWVLVDAGDVIVHLFQPEMRQYYRLETMWGDDFDSHAQPPNPKVLPSR